MLHNEISLLKWLFVNYVINAPKIKNGLIIKINNIIN